MPHSKEIVVRLIQDDLKHSKFIYLLERLELTPSSHYLDLGETLILLMKFKKALRDKAYDFYLKLKKRYISRDFLGNSKALTKLALVIYNKLVKFGEL